MYNPNKYLPQTHYHPIYQDKVKIKYTIEYTDKDEDIDINYSNLKKIKCEDFEKMIKYMFQLRQNEKYNINLYFIIEESGGNNWLIEDYCNCCEDFLDNKKSVEINRKNQEIKKEITELSEELKTYKDFIKLFHAEKHFEKFRKGELELKIG